jgi:hypothetical protein
MTQMQMLYFLMGLFVAGEPLASGHFCQSHVSRIITGQTQGHEAAKPIRKFWCHGKTRQTKGQNSLK